jgi:hypothetical protein
MREGPYNTISVGDLTVKIYQDMDASCPEEHYDEDMCLVSWSRELSVKVNGLDCLADFSEFMHPTNLDEYEYPDYVRHSLAPEVKPEVRDELWMEVYRECTGEIEQLLLATGEVTEFEKDYEPSDVAACLLAHEDLSRRMEVWEAWSQYHKAHAEYACFVVGVQNYGGGNRRVYLGDRWEGEWDRHEPEAMIRIKRDAGWRADLKEVAESMIKEMNQYLEGDVWGYVIEDEEGSELDSCWGMFGDDHCEAEARSMALHLDATRTKQLKLPFAQGPEHP